QDSARPGLSAPSAQHPCFGGEIKKYYRPMRGWNLGATFPNKVAQIIYMGLDLYMLNQIGLAFNIFIV
ncbi:MAG TPA: hypothetical protein VEC37_18500, partial [Bacillota bacterium]|nr:hypothetical protein [Bacillota bacterium]